MRSGLLATSIACERPVTKLGHLEVWLDARGFQELARMSAESVSLATLVLTALDAARAAPRSSCDCGVLEKTGTFLRQGKS